MEQAHRPIRLLLNAQLVRRTDEVIASGVGGFTTREELVEEALNSYLLELQDVGLLSASGDTPVGVRKGSNLPSRRPGMGRAPTKISPPPRGFASNGDEIIVEDIPLLGLHNRDWPSLWALSRLAHVASTGPVSFPSYLESVTEEAWQLAASLMDELGAHSKAATQMLPTNILKKQAADAGFQNFAIGSLSNKPLGHGLHKAAGPLPAWRTISFARGKGEFQVALTRQGWELLEIVEGLDPEQPHNQRVAKAFFGYLQDNSPADWWGFKTVLREIAQMPTRYALLLSMKTARDWTPSIASSATQGYIARSREWGLVEPKLVGGTYRLTEFGKEILHNV